MMPACSRMGVLMAAEGVPAAPPLLVPGTGGTLGMKTARQKDGVEKAGRLLPAATACRA